MKKILLAAALVASVFTAQSQKKALYYVDYVLGADQMDSALTNLGYLVTKVTDNPTFQTEIATPANYDIAIYISQNYGADATSSYALANFIELGGKKGVFFDYSGNNAIGDSLGVNYITTYNETTVTVTDAALAAGLTTNPFTITNPGTGWGIFAVGLTPLAGSTTVATFSPSGNAAMVRSMGGDMLVLGFTSDVLPESVLFENGFNGFFTSVGTEVENTIVANVYPNPSNGAFTVLTNQGCDLTIVDAQGKTVHTQSVLASENSAQVDLKGMAKGMYTMLVTTANGTTSKKIIIE